MLVGAPKITYGLLEFCHVWWWLVKLEVLFLGLLDILCAYSYRHTTKYL